MKVLVIDAGNTRVKWGIHDGREWFLHGAHETASIGAPGAFAHIHKENAFDRIIVSNVAGAGVANAIRDALYGYGTAVTFIAARVAQCGVESRYENPEQLGSDRWAALVAAHAAAVANARAHPDVPPRAQLVVMAGTALTIDALDAAGVFLGGVIVPGPALMRLSLNRATAQLPSVSAATYQAFPRNTPSAILSGAIEACAGAIQRMYAHLSVHNGEAPHCVGSGGAMEALSHHLPFPLAIDENLVLEGLLEIARAES